MRRSFLICIVILIVLVSAGLSLTATDPDDFIGQWYSAADQSVYQFREGLIFCAKHTVPLSDAEVISGAYSFGKDSIFLFATGIPGLETERELFLIARGEECFLCENPDGTGTVYFIRYQE